MNAAAGPNSLRPHERPHHRLLLRQFGSPIVLLLIGAAVLSVLLHDARDGAIVLLIVVVSRILGLSQESGRKHRGDLLSKAEFKATVMRSGETQVPVNRSAR